MATTEKELTLDDLSRLFETQISAIQDLPALENLRVEWIGKKGHIPLQMRNLGKVAEAERKILGQKINEVKTKVESELDRKHKTLFAQSLNEQLEKERVDVTLPGVPLAKTCEHPVWKVQAELVKIFSNCGFVVEMGPEVEHEFFNFDALNMPKNHPARAMQDTFYIAGEKELVLRTHTSPVQIRTMLLQPPPIRMICPGRVYRSDYDPTHSPMFHQIEGLLVDQDVVMGDLKGLLDHMVKEFFGASLGVRLRPSFFPFTEPSAEVDMACVFCSGKGCKTCKQTGWIEIGGCGMVDPEVFKSVDLNPEKWSGFAFGMGLERMTMLKYGVSDLRSFFESDQRFLREFS